MNQPEPQIVAHLKEEIKNNRGNDSPFAQALRDQMQKLQNVQDRVAAELNSPAVQNNQTAQKQDVSLQDILMKAIAARRQALGEEVSKK